MLSPSTASAELLSSHPRSAHPPQRIFPPQGGAVTSLCSVHRRGWRNNSHRILGSSPALHARPNAVLIVQFQRIAPTWLLPESDWAFTPCAGRAPRSRRPLQYPPFPARPLSAAIPSGTDAAVRAGLR